MKKSGVFDNVFWREISIFIRNGMIALLWVIIASIFGLAQLWISIGISLYFNNINNTIEKMVSDGVILFFMMALVVIIAVDFYFNPFIIDLHPGVQAVLFVASPLLVGIYTSATYAALFVYNDKQDVVYSNLMSGQNAALLFTLTYALVTKYLQFLPSTLKEMERNFADGGGQ